MAGQGKYTVIELSEALNVPRTTINDWLTRYSHYIDFVLQGRRKIYTDESIAVLKEISELRNSGLSSYDIEAELSKRHPVRGEPQAAQEEPKPQAAPQMGQQPNAEGAQTPKDAFHQQPAQGQPVEEFALMSKRQTDEIGRMIGESFQNMARRIEDIERNSAKANARATRWYLLSFALLLLLLLAGAMTFIKMQRISSMRDELAKADSEKSSQLLTLQKTLQDNTVNLSKQSDELRRNVEALEKGLVEQRVDFDKALQQAKGEGEAARQAETSRLRDNFAAERLELLKKLEAAASNPALKEEILNGLKKKLSEEGEALKAAQGNQGPDVQAKQQP